MNDSDTRNIATLLLTPSAENNLLYRPIDEDDPDLQELARSIEERGVLEPLVITKDYYILSGHRRHAAAKIAGIELLPCRVVDINADDDPDEYVRMLREYNRQRDKTIAEKLREEVVSTDPQQAYEELKQHRFQLVRQAARQGRGDIRLRDNPGRSKITKAKKPFLDAIVQIVEQNKRHWPLSVRQVHYRLLNVRPLKHASKPASKYGNNTESYNALVDLLCRARIAGKVPMHAISDDTRPGVEWNTWTSPAAFIRREIDDLFLRYWRDLQVSQPMHIELIAEKNTVFPIVRRVASRYTIPVTSGRGYASLPPRAAIYDRFEASNKDVLALVVVSDFDPDGEEIAHSLARSMRDDFGIREDRIIARKAALTAEQVKERDMPPSLDAKPTSSRFKRFAEAHGTKAYELEALDPDELEQLVTDAVDDLTLTRELEQERQQERDDSAFLRTVHEHVRESMKGIGDGFGGAE